MNQAQARRRIWERLATTAICDADNGDWIYDEVGNEADVRRLTLACNQVAASIRKKLARGSKR